MAVVTNTVGAVNSPAASTGASFGSALASLSLMPLNIRSPDEGSRDNQIAGSFRVGHTMEPEIAWLVVSG